MRGKQLQVVCGGDEIFFGGKKKRDLRLEQKHFLRSTPWGLALHEGAWEGEILTLLSVTDAIKD